MFFTFEGIEGSGKSTVHKRIATHLTQKGLDVLVTREPGGSTLGRNLRSVLLDTRTEGLNPRAELYLFLADRAQHVSEVIKPALDAGQIVLCDRYIDSTLAYQGFGRGMDVDHLVILNDIATSTLKPDLTILLDLPVKIGLERAGARNRNEGTVISEGRFESESINFHERIRNGYLTLAKENPERFAIIDSTQSQEDVFIQCIATIEKYIEKNL